ncbi:iron-sulfur cluster repair protein YtfE [Aliiglaciecola sp. CAU 1673]|uniref:iron-sulfur cluster repair protein YtfE n=1 Tax=Aliiglaciecola sp. CAU 1673 TaxID=3032595 RepID=UPI0023DBD165|nr:iron-sulfur cluster repair protein YtfE [Aliiglaciecola sp. CAU 1673]MDF2177425.1 iron-sulfur cluster repair protein YtfE [Aliiglaciecola sp. CAU 1673]
MSILNQSLAELAINVGGATRVFHQYGLDFCCAGQQTLAEALQRRGVDEKAVLTALDNLAQCRQPEPDWSQQPVADLVQHILDRFHDKHRRQMPELIRLAQRVETVHQASPDCPSGLAEHLTLMLDELESHMLKEEQILFPMLINGMYPQGPINVMLEDHLEHGQALEKMVMLAHHFILPEGACNSWRALYAGVQELKEDLMEHIHLENHILFVPRHVKA